MLWRSPTVAFAGTGSVDLPALAQSQGGSAGKPAPGMERSAPGPADAMPDGVQTDSSPARTLRGSTEIAMWSAIP